MPGYATQRLCIGTKPEGSVTSIVICSAEDQGGGVQEAEIDF